MQTDMAFTSPRRWAMAAAAVLLLLAGAAYLGFWLGQANAASATGGVAMDTEPATSQRPSATRPAGLGPARPAPEGVSRSAIQWPLWEHELEAGIPSRETALTPPPWRLLGAAMVGGQWQLIVLRQGAQDAEYYKKGDRLPGGYVIRDINQEDVTLGLGRREIILSYIGY